MYAVVTKGLQKKKEDLEKAINKMDPEASVAWAEVLVEPTLTLLDGLAEASPPPLSVALMPSPW